MPPLGDYPENDCSCQQRAEVPDAAVAPGERAVCDELSRQEGWRNRHPSPDLTIRNWTVTALPLAFVTSKGKFAIGLLPSTILFCHLRRDLWEITTMVFCTDGKSSFYHHRLN